MITIREAALKYNVAPNSIYEAARDGNWPFEKRGKAYYYSEEVVEKFCHQQEMQETRQIIEWADGLASFPTPLEISAHASEYYPYKNVLSVVQTRGFREGKSKLWKEGKIEDL